MLFNPAPIVQPPSTPAQRPFGIGSFPRNTSTPGYASPLWSPGLGPSSFGSAISAAFGPQVASRPPWNMFGPPTLQSSPLSRAFGSHGLGPEPPADPLRATAQALGVAPQALFNTPSLAAQVKNAGLHPQAGQRGGQMPLDWRVRRLRAIKARRARPNVPPPPRVPPTPLDFRQW